MLILTQTGLLENSENVFFQIEDARLEKQYLDNGYQRFERSYKIKERYKEYMVICPEYRNDAEGLEPIVIIPEFHIPGRPYPVYIYLYAIDLYSSNLKKGQRWAAQETRKYFGLATFAHTTLGRALKAFIHIIDVDTILEPTVDKEIQPRGFPSIQTTAVLRKQAARFLRGVLLRGRRQQTIATCLELARGWFWEHQCLLL